MNGCREILMDGEVGGGIKGWMWMDDFRLKWMYREMDG